MHHAGMVSWKARVHASRLVARCLVVDRASPNEFAEAVDDYHSLMARPLYGWVI